MNWVARHLAVLRVGLQFVVRHPGRTTLSCISLVIGITSIVAVQVTSTSIQDAMIRSEELARGRDGSAVASVAVSDAHRAVVTEVIDQLKARSLMIMDHEDFTGLAPGGESIAVRVFRGNLTAAYPLGTDGDLRPYQVVANEAAMTLLDGQSVRVIAPGGLSYSVVTPTAVVDDGDHPPAIFIPDTWLAVSPSSGQFTLWYTDAEGNQERARQRLSEALTAAGFDDVQVGTVDARRGVEQFIRLIRTGFLIVGAGTLAVGVLSILNIGLATIRTRAEELALRRAMGATRGNLALMVLIEGALIGLLGSVIAVGLCLAAMPLLSSVFGVALSLPWSATGFGVAVGLVSGTAGSLVPAVQAAKMPIVAVMRA